MTYYGKQRFESFKRAMFAARISERSSFVPVADVEDEKHTGESSLWLAGILTSSRPSADQLAS